MIDACMCRCAYIIHVQMYIKRCMSKLRESCIRNIGSYMYMYPVRIHMYCLHSVRTATHMMPDANANFASLYNNNKLV